MLRAFCIFLLFVASQLFSGFIALMMVNWGNICTDQPMEWLLGAGLSPTFLATSMILSGVLLFVLLWSLRLTSNHPLASIMMPRCKRGWLLVGSFLLTGVGLSLFLQPLGLDDGGMNELFRQGKNNVWMLLLVCLVTPVIEEVVFRDGIQRQLSEIGLKPWIAISTTALTFAIVHGNLAQFFPAFLLGVMLGWLYYKTGDLRLCVPAHILNNSLAVLELHLPSTETFLANSPAVLLYVVGGSMAILGGGLFYRHYSK